MKILVTGATGFIGAAIARKLSQQRHEILALSRSDSAAAKLRSAGLIPVFGDFADPVSLAAPAAQVDAIVSTASIGQVEGTPDSFAKDRDAVAVITKALGDSGKPLIFTSGSAIFGVFTKGEASPTIFDEDHPVPLPASVFAPPEVEIPAPFIDAFGGAMVRRVETETAVLKAGGVRGIAIRPGLSTARARAPTCPISSPWPGRTAPRLTLEREAFGRATSTSTTWWSSTSRPLNAPRPARCYLLVPATLHNARDAHSIVSIAFVDLHLQRCLRMPGVNADDGQSHLIQLGPQPRRRCSSLEPNPDDIRCVRFDECRDRLRIGCDHTFALDLPCPIDDADRGQL
jgi:hypothetical protein